ncbi:MAG TPA: MarR family winged helix-turn-helix transcriptional regulator [Ramlibacter sp.]|jgi:DNA-binding MarR family transcriptional regulator|nr:MarR family winged helix-turn-helix transcriptional regulator [Ramlibacter sp.]
MADKRQPAFHNQLSYQVTSTADALRRSAAMQMRREHDLSLAQVRTLSLILHLQPVRLRDVAADAGADKAQISRVVTSLVGRGYVARRALAGDARSAHLELTEPGRAKMASIEHSLNERDRVLRSTLQPGEVEQLTALLACVRKGADGLTLEEERFEKTMSQPAVHHAV